MGTTKKKPRRAKAAGRALKALTMRQTTRGGRHVNAKPDSIDETERELATARAARHAETKKRNAAAQEIGEHIKRRKTGSQVGLSDTNHFDADRDAFFASIDEPLYRVCGSCGELAKAAKAVLKLYDPKFEFFSPLQNDLGVVEIIDEGLVQTSSKTSQSIWICSRCSIALRAKKTPKFSRCSGFRIAAIPEVLAELNRIETRLIGLGICFTTCVNLYCDGQEFTKGNAINYWNEPAEIVRELPRPLKECGVVFLASKSATTIKYFRVRPDLLRHALHWLVVNNPLYKHITVSEDNLKELENIDANRDVPTIPITEDEIEELEGERRQINEEEHEDVQQTVDSVDTDATQRTIGSRCGYTSMPQYDNETQDTVPMRETEERASCSELEQDTTTQLDYSQDVREEPSEQDVMSSMTESFELEGNQSGKQSELERIMGAVGIEPAVDCPIGELRCPGGPINENT